MKCTVFYHKMKTCFLYLVISFSLQFDLFDLFIYSLGSFSAPKDITFYYVFVWRHAAL